MALQLCDLLAGSWATTAADSVTPATGLTTRSPSLTLLLTTLSLLSNELKLTSVLVALAMMRIFFKPSTNLESSSISWTTHTTLLYRPTRTKEEEKVLTSFRDLSSSQLKLLSSKAKKRLSTKKLPMTRAGRKMEKQISEP